MKTLDEVIYGGMKHGIAFQKVTIKPYKEHLLQSYHDDSFSFENPVFTGKMMARMENVIDEGNHDKRLTSINDFTFKHRTSIKGNVPVVTEFMDYHIPFLENKITRWMGKSYQWNKLSNHLVDVVFNGLDIVGLKFTTWWLGKRLLRRDLFVRSFIGDKKNIEKKFESNDLLKRWYDRVVP